jgi:hypothetical protein
MTNSMKSENKLDGDMTVFSVFKVLEVEEEASE